MPSAESVTQRDNLITSISLQRSPISQLRVGLSLSPGLHFHPTTCHIALPTPPPSCHSDSISSTKVSFPLGDTPAGHSGPGARLPASHPCQLYRHHNTLSPILSCVRGPKALHLGHTQEHRERGGGCRRERCCIRSLSTKADGRNWISGSQ